MEERERRAKWMLRAYHMKMKTIKKSCRRCGSRAHLHFHHKRDKAFSITKRWSCSNFWEELKKCEVICRNCHKKKHAAKHGSLSRYSHQKCRCWRCRAAWNKRSREYRREWRKKKAL